jgi:capsular polysaccharide biosynthesis protein
MGKQQFIHYRSDMERQWVREFDLPLVSIQNALVTDIRRPKDRLRRASFVGGVYDSSGTLVGHSERRVAPGRKPDNPQCLTLPAARRIPGRAFFGGILFRSFGHCLIETMSRLWAVAELREPTDRFVFQAWGRGCTPQLFDRPYVRFMLEALGIDTEKCELVADEPIICEELIVPASTIVVNGYVHPRFIETYDRILAAHGLAPESMRRIYLTRGGLDRDHRHAANEGEIEALLMTQGFTVLRPENLPFDQQVRIMQGAEVIAGTDGSAMHMVAFARPSAKVLAFEGRVSANQYAVEAARGVDAVHVLANAGPRPNQAPDGSSWIADLDRVQEGLRLLELAA